MKHIVRLRGENIDLCIARTDREALEIYTKWMNDESILMWIGRNFKVTQWADEKEWVENLKDKNTFNICTKDCKIIGNCDIRQIGNSRNYTLGICIGEETGRDRGYGTEAVKMLVKFAFEECNAHRVRLTVNGDNSRAINCYIKAGFKTCGVEHEAHWYKGHWCDTVYMEILEQDYYKEIVNGVEVGEHCVKFSNGLTFGVGDEISISLKNGNKYIGVITSVRTEFFVIDYVEENGKAINGLSKYIPYQDVVRTDFVAKEE